MVRSCPFQAQRPQAQGNLAIPVLALDVAHHHRDQLLFEFRGFQKLRTRRAQYFDNSVGRVDHEFGHEIEITFLRDESLKGIYGRLEKVAAAGSHEAARPVDTQVGREVARGLGDRERPVTPRQIAPFFFPIGNWRQDPDPIAVELAAYLVSSTILDEATYPVRSLVS
jgi:hypothetical protein